MHFQGNGTDYFYMNLNFLGLTSLLFLLSSYERIKLCFVSTTTSNYDIVNFSKLPAGPVAFGYILKFEHHENSNVEFLP